MMRGARGIGRGSAGAPRANGPATRDVTRCRIRARMLPAAALLAVVLGVAGCAGSSDGGVTAVGSVTGAAQPTSTVGIPAVLARVVDGDTIHATIGGTDETIRIIGLDSPETVKPGTPVECFAREATTAAKRLLPIGAPIRLQSDPTQAARDRYGRLLAHVILPDGRLFAEVMIEGGFATHYVYDGVPSIYADRLSAAEDRAIAAEAGLWSPTTCAGDGHSSSAVP